MSKRFNHWTYICHNGFQYFTHEIFILNIFIVLLPTPPMTDSKGLKQEHFVSFEIKVHYGVFIIIVYETILKGYVA